MREVLEGSELELDIREAANGEDALVQALTGEVDIVISDIVMPGLSGIELVRLIRQERDADTLPVVLVTAAGDDAVREESFTTGASDYLTKPFSSAELISRVQVQLRLKRLQLELRRANERLRKLGSYDELTGLANRRHLKDVLRRELARSRRYSFSMSVVALDLDRFRDVNRRLGPLIGDAILTEVSELLLQQLRTPDVVARTGGEKFAAVLPQTDAEQTALVCNRLCDAVRKYAFPGLEVGELTLAIGFATYPSGNLESVDELLSAAEASLERAKAAGGDRVQRWVEGGAA